MKDYEVWALSERAKELECLYAVDGILQNKQLTIPAAMYELIKIIPLGFAYPNLCKIQIKLNENIYETDNFKNSIIITETSIVIGSDTIGYINVGYEKDKLESYTALEDEIKMMSSIAWRISLLTLTTQNELSILFDMLKRIDPNMLLRICEKLRTYLIKNFGEKINTYLGELGIDDSFFYGESNVPLEKSLVSEPIEISKKLIASAAMFLTSNTITELINRWIINERAFSLINVVDSKDATVENILEAVRRYTKTVDEQNRNPITEKWLLSELCHRFLTTDEDLISLVIDNLKLSDFESMMAKIIASDKCSGNIGGKGAGIFIAKQLIENVAKEEPLLADIKTPHTWYISTDQITEFLHYNYLEEMRSYKFHSPMHLRITYKNIVKRIKNASLTPYVVKMLKILLDEMEGVPLIVRSSSLLEDRMNSAFSGKYKSLFLANCGSKEQRLEELSDAILEVYASMYNPDSLCYRKERNLINYSEKMGILIQEVVGKKVGPYYLPVFAGVAFSENQLRWSTRINREDGLVRMVFGLGTRAVDRVNDDYPILFSPSKPQLRTNHTPEEIVYYSQKYVDVINLEKQKFETIEVKDLLKDYGKEIPTLDKIVSVYSDMMIQDKSFFTLNPQKDDMVVTLNGYINKGDIPSKLKYMLNILSEKMRVPIDLEFAFDGENIYLLQCRAQGRGIQKSPAPIPANLPPQDILFTTDQYITNGLVNNITHIVYVDPTGYSNLRSREQLLDVGKAVGLLGNLLQRKQYILMGPGRWGSRGDVTLGVHVTYNDIANTAALIEIANKKHNYVPELSFGTHFFQDLVEADIVYIPLYPDNEVNILRQGFFFSSENLLPEILPEYSYLADTLKVIDIGRSYFGKTLSIHMNSDLEQAVAFFTDEKVSKTPTKKEMFYDSKLSSDNSIEHWQWRKYMAEQIALEANMDELGIKNIYLIGSTNTGHCRINSDIDLLIHFYGNDSQRALLKSWLMGWSKALAKQNFLRTGYTADEILDVHIITDDDIKNGDSFTQKIDSITDPATLLR